MFQNGHDGFIPKTCLYMCDVTLKLALIQSLLVALDNLKQTKKLGSLGPVYMEWRGGGGVRTRVGDPATLGEAFSMLSRDKLFSNKFQHF